ncbi:VOC family protein [Chloroflexota bacterium]
MMQEQSPFRNFGQVGIVVKDIEKTIKNLSEIGIGQFGPLKAEPTVKWEEKGKPTEIRLKMRFVNIGPLEIELIEPVSECMQKKYLDTHGEGIHHIAFFVKDINEEVKRMVARGYKVVQRGWRPTSGGYAFFNTQESCGFMLEIIQR